MAARAVCGGKGRSYHESQQAGTESVPLCCTAHDTTKKDSKSACMWDLTLSRTRDGV